MDNTRFTNGYPLRDVRFLGASYNFLYDSKCDVWLIYLEQGFCGNMERGWKITSGDPSCRFG